MKKKVCIIILIVLIIMLLTLGGYLIYLKTDLFKSNEQLFWKYLSQNSQMGKIMVNTEINENEIKLKKESNIDKIKINALGYNVNIDSNVDNKNKDRYSKINISSNNEEIINFEILKNKETYGITSDEIINAYVCLENKNLKEFYNKFQLEGEGNIPNTINTNNINELFKMTEQEDKHIKETYMKIITDYLDDNKYVKQKNISVNNIENVDMYSLILTKAETKGLFIKIIENLKQDSITLNYLTTNFKILNLSQQYTDINNFNLKLSEYLEEINKIEESNEEVLKLTVYVKNHKTIRTDIIYNNEIFFSISFDLESNYIETNIQKSDNNINLKIQKTKESQEDKTEISIKSNETKIQINDKKSIKDNVLNQYLSIYRDEEEIANMERIIEKSDSIINTIKQFKDLKTIKLNDMSSEKINKLYNAIEERMTYVINKENTLN